jgi:hypothetical protein
MSKELKISGVSKEERSYEKQITFTRGGSTYYARLYWESGEGFDLTFTNAEGESITTPKWAVDWEEEEQDLTYEESLAFTLDQLTDEKLEEVE